MPVANVRAALNVLSVIAHKALLNGDDRQVVYESTTMLVEFIKKHDPQPEAPQGAPITPAAEEQVDTAIKAAKNKITAKPTPAAKPRVMPPPKLDHSQLPKVNGSKPAAPVPPVGVARKPKS